MVLVVLAMLPPDDRPGVTKANFDRVQDGMTKAEVEAIFGEKGKQPYILELSFEPHELAAHVSLCREGFDGAVWRSGDSGATIAFCNDRVVLKRWGGSTETIFDKVCRWLRL